MKRDWSLLLLGLVFVCGIGSGVASYYQYGDNLVGAIIGGWFGFAIIIFGGLAMLRVWMVIWSAFWRFINS